MPPRTTPTITSAPARVATIGDEVGTTRESAVAVEVAVVVAAATEVATAADDDATVRATADAPTTETVQGANASIAATRIERKARHPSTRRERETAAAAAAAAAEELGRNERRQRSRG